MGESKRCAECGHAASPEARFCEQCGSALTPGAEPLRAPDALAAKIRGERAAIEGERKQVTVMFADIVSSMELTRSLETERWGVVLDRFLTIACAAIHQLEGTVNQFTGDGLMAVFGAPLAHEDHARRACLTALELQGRIGPFAEELARSDGVEFTIRCGLNSGEVIVGSIGDDLHMDFAPIGNTSGMGKRMESLAPSGSTAISASTAALVDREFELRELGEFEVKGAAEPQRVFELLGHGPAHSRLEAAEARGLSRFVGRQEERARLEAALEAALVGEGRTIAITGDPGVGKSRLCVEFLAGCREHGLSVNSAAALAHGRRVPLLPVLAMLRDYFGIVEREQPDLARDRIESVLLGLDPAFESELPLIFDFLGVADPARPPERTDPEARQRRLLALVSDLVRARSAREPGVVLIEDLHWIDDASAVFLEQLIAAVEGTRTLLLVTYRREYEAGWIEDRAEQLIELSPLDEGESDALLGELLGTDPSLAALAEAIRERTGGNPFFIEELVQGLVETDHLAGARGSYRLVQALAEVVLPPTVQAVLSARIDRLPPREKRLVQMMSVIGKEISEPILRSVTTLDQAALTDSVAALEAAHLLTERSNGHREFVFKHPLTQEVAYASQLSAPRARAHTAVADAIERTYPDGLDERAALLAHHSEAAGEMLKAAQWHARAAGWVSVASPAEGMRHWRRVREITDELESSSEVDQLAVLARISILSLAWRLGMSHEETAEIHSEGEERLGGSAADTASVAQADHEREAALAGRDAQGSATEQVLLDLGQAGALFVAGREREGLEALRPAQHAAEAIGDPGLLLTVNAAGLIAFWVRGVSLHEGFEAADRAIRLAGDDLRAGSGLAFVSPFAHCLWVRAACRGFLGDVAGARRDYERSLELAREHGDRESEQYALNSRSGLLSQTGFSREALADAERSIERAEETGIPITIAAAQSFLAAARLHADDAEGARDAAERALSTIRELSLGRNFEPWLLATLAEAQLRLGDQTEALRAAEEATTIARERSLQGINAYLALARALRETRGADAADALAATLDTARDEIETAGFRIYAPNLHRELAALARLRGDEAEAEREEGEAERILAEIRDLSGPDQEARQQEVQAIALDMVHAAAQLFGGSEQEGAAALKAGYRRVLELGQPALALEASSAAGYACWVTGSPREGIDFIDRAFDQADEEVLSRPGLALKSPYAHALWIRALCSTSIGHSAAALDDLARSARLAQERGDVECEGNAHECRSRTLLDLDQVAAARADAEQAVEIAEAAGNHQALASALASLAAIGSEAADFEAALDAATAGLEILKRHDAGLLWEPDLLAARARAQLGLGRADEGRTSAEQARAIAADRALPRAEILGHLALAQVLIETDGPAAAAEIESALQRARELANRHEYRSTERSIHRQLAALARLRGDEAAAEIEEADAERVLAQIKATEGG